MVSRRSAISIYLDRSTLSLDPEALEGRLPTDSIPKIFNTVMA